MNEQATALTGSAFELSPDQQIIFEKFRQVGDTMTGKPRGTGLGVEAGASSPNHAS